MSRAKKWYLWELQKHDLAHDTTIVRELEMTCDSVITPSDYVPQFWKDAQVYGIDEAILYVRNGGYGNADAIAEVWKRIRHKHLGG